MWITIFHVPFKIVKLLLFSAYTEKKIEWVESYLRPELARDRQPQLHPQLVPFNPLPQPAGHRGQREDMALLTPKPGLTWKLSALTTGASDLSSGLCILLDILWEHPVPAQIGLGGQSLWHIWFCRGTCPLELGKGPCTQCPSLSPSLERLPMIVRAWTQPEVELLWGLPITIVVLSVQVRGSQTWHYWHFGPDDSYCCSYALWECSETSLVSTH